MSTQCVACKKTIKRGQLFCSDCLQKQAPAGVQKRERRRRGELLEWILSLPFLAVTINRQVTIDRETAWWNRARPVILHNPTIKNMFTSAASHLHVPITIGSDDWICRLDPPTARTIVTRLADEHRVQSSRRRTEVQEVQRRFLVLSSPLLGLMVAALAVLGLVLLIAL